MRNVPLFSLALTIVAVAGCSSQPKEQPVRSDLERDLTLASRVSDTTVTSPLELGEARSEAGKTLHRVVQHRSVPRHRPARRAATKVAEPVRSAPTAQPVIADVAAPSPGAQPATAVPADSRELLPGKTVTVIPVSSGPSPSGGERRPDYIPFRGGTGRGDGGGGWGGGSGMGGSGMGGSGMGGSGMGGCPGRGAPAGIASRPLY